MYLNRRRHSHKFGKCHAFLCPSIKWVCRSLCWELVSSGWVARGTSDYSTSPTQRVRYRQTVAQILTRLPPLLRILQRRKCIPFPFSPTAPESSANGDSSETYDTASHITIDSTPPEVSAHRSSPTKNPSPTLQLGSNFKMSEAVMGWRPGGDLGTSPSLRLRHFASIMCLEHENMRGFTADFNVLF